MTHEEVVKNFTAGKCKRGISPRDNIVAGDAGNMLYRNDILYSFGIHHALAVKLSECFYLKNIDRYSSSTSAHQRLCHRLPGAEISFRLLGLVGIDLASIQREDVIDADDDSLLLRHRDRLFYINGARQDVLLEIEPFTENLSLSGVRQIIYPKDIDVYRKEMILLKDWFLLPEKDLEERIGSKFAWSRKEFIDSCHRNMFLIGSGEGYATSSETSATRPWTYLDNKGCPPYLFGERYQPSGRYKASKMFLLRNDDGKAVFDAANRYDWIGKSTIFVSGRIALCHLSGVRADRVPPIVLSGWYKAVPCEYSAQVLQRFTI